jgi:hypothetical protein
MNIVEHAGAKWCTVEDGARYLRTTTPKVRELMGANKLGYTQIRANGRVYVSVAELVEIQTAKVEGRVTFERKSVG